MTLKNILLVLPFAVFLSSCSDPLDVDVSGITIDTKFINMDSTLFYSDSVELMNAHQNYKTDINEFYSYQLGYCMQIFNNVDTTFYNSLQDFKTDTFIIRLERNIKNEFSDLSKTKTLIADGLKHLKYHLPNDSVPENVIFMNSLFNSSVWCTETELGIGLERYLGKENECIQRLNPMHYHDWIKEDMNKEYLERDAIVGWLSTNVIEEIDGSLAEKIVRWGKIIHLTKAAFPDKEDHWIMRYTKEEIEWAEENKHGFWEYLVKEKLLFDTNERNAMNMLSPGPTTPGLPESGGPDRLGQYLGWKMVKSYLEQFEITMEELLELPYNDILQEFEIDN